MVAQLARRFRVTVVPVGDQRRRGARPRARRRLPLQRTRGPGGAGRPGGRDRPTGRRRCRSSASASGHQLLATRLGGDDLQAALRSPRLESPGAGPRDRAASRSRRRTTTTPSCPSRSRARVVSHVNLNDGVIEGVASTAERCFSVQYHPEAGPGPHDARYLFERFETLLRTGQLESTVMPRRAISQASWSSARVRSSSARRVSSTTRAPRPARCCAPTASR